MIALLVTWLAFVDGTATQYLVDRAVSGSTFWAVGCLGGAGVRMVGQRWVRGR